MRLVVSPSKIICSRSRGEKTKRSKRSSLEPPSSSSGSDDVRSFCDSIAHMTGKLTKSFFGPWSMTTVTTQPHPMPNSSRFDGLQGLEKTYVEMAQIPQTAPGMTVLYDSERDVQELTYFGASQCMEKQSKRGARNPWRQYGALRKLHEIGGNAPEQMDKKHRKKGSTFIKIKKGTSPPNPPETPEIVLNGTRDISILRRLHCPCGVPAEQLAQNVALQMQSIARDAFLESTDHVLPSDINRKARQKTNLKHSRE